MAYKRRRKLTKKQKRKMILQGVILFLAFVGAVTLLSMTVNGVKRLFGKTGAVDAPQIDEQLLTVNEYSRPGIALGKINEYGLTTEDVIRHYDVTGKDCPKY